MAKLKVKLLHTSHLAGAAGNPGDTVEVDEARAAQWLEAGGAVAVADDKPAKTDKPAKADKA